MYDYSPINKIYIRNFRNLGDVEIDMTESPIVALTGENDAGKTSVIKAFSICTLHANPRDQKDYIRDETNMFGVAIDLDNGTRITRIKQKDGVNSYSIVRPDGTQWNIGKITDGLPEEVSKILGLIAEPETGEFLHIRTYEDKLLFVVTTNSTNYKVMYNALKVEQITKAIKNGSTEVNGLKSEINKNNISIDTLSNQCKMINIVDMESLNSIKDRLKEQMQCLDKIEQSKKLVDQINNCENNLGALVLIDKFGLTNIDELYANNIISTGNLLKSLSELNKVKAVIDKIDGLEEINSTNLITLENIINKKADLLIKTKEAGMLIEVANLEEIPELLVSQLSIIKASVENNKTKEQLYNIINTDSCTEVNQSDINSIDKLTKMSNMISEINTKEQQLVQINNYIDQVYNYMKQLGVAVETCPNCGTDIVIDVNKLETI